MLGELFGGQWVVKKSDSGLFFAFSSLKTNPEGRHKGRGVYTTVNGQTTYLDWEICIQFLAQPKVIQLPAGSSETWVFWGKLSSAQIYSQFDEEVLEFIAVGSAFMLMSLKDGLL